MRDRRSYAVRLELSLLQNAIIIALKLHGRVPVFVDTWNFRKSGFIELVSVNDSSVISVVFVGQSSIGTSIKK